MKSWLWPWLTFCDTTKMAHAHELKNFSCPETEPETVSKPQLLYVQKHDLVKEQNKVVSSLVHLQFHFYNSMKVIPV